MPPQVQRPFAAANPTNSVHTRKAITRPAAQHQPEARTGLNIPKHPAMFP
jgi:hypothetical protein